MCEQQVQRIRELEDQNRELESALQVMQHCARSLMEWKAGLVLQLDKEISRGEEVERWGARMA